MKIGELAREAGVHVSTIRFYEREGLMPKPETRESGYREYTQHDLERLRLIVAAKRQRFPLSLIQVCLAALNHEHPCEEIADVVSDRIKAIDKEVVELQRLRLHLAAQLRAWNLGALPKADCLCAILQTDAQHPRKEKQMANKRNIEVFIAGCPLCDEAVKTVRSVACDSCEVTIFDLREGCASNECLQKAQQYGIHKVPAVVIDGQLCDCCQHGAVTAEGLRSAGIGQAL